MTTCCMTHGELAMLVEWLVDEHGFDAASIVRVVEKPWKWNHQLAHCRAALLGAPEPTCERGCSMCRDHDDD